jgi:hypothetical protein
MCSKHGSLDDDLPIAGIFLGTLFITCVIMITFMLAMRAA